METLINQSTKPNSRKVNADLATCAPEDIQDAELVHVIVSPTESTSTGNNTTVHHATHVGTGQELVDPNHLTPHPRNAEVYGDAPLEPDFLEAIQRQGVLLPLMALEDGTILSGHRRHKAAVHLGLKQIPVIRLHPADETEELEILLDGNRQREKTNEQKAREYMLLKEIEDVKAKKRQSTKTAEGQPVKTFTQAEKGKARDKAAKELKISGVTAQRGSQVAEAIDRLVSEKRTNDATDLRAVFNAKSTNAAYKMAQELGMIEPPKARKAPANALKAGAKAAPVASAPAKKEQPPLELPESEEDTHHTALEQLRRVVRHLESVADDSLDEAVLQEWEEQAAEFFNALRELGIEPDFGLRSASKLKPAPARLGHNLGKKEDEEYDDDEEEA